MKIGGAFPVRFMARDGVDGKSAPYVLFRPDVVLFQTGSGGAVASAQSKQVEMTLFVGGDKAVISNVAKNSCPAGVTLSAFTISGGVASVTLSVAAGTTEANLSGIVNLTITGSLGGKSVSAAANFSVNAVKQGEQGVQGLSGAVLRNRGRFKQSELNAFAGDAIVNNQYWIDYLTYVPNEGGASKYRLADGVTEWMPTYYIRNGVQTQTQIPVLPGNPLVWTEFSSLKDTVVNFLIANGIAASSANLCEAFIGQTSDGVTDNGNGTFGLTSQAVGWAITAGKIFHTKTGLTLTQDGYLNDPDGLHIHVDGKTLVKTNYLPWAGFPSSPYASVGYVSYVTSEGTYTPLGEKILRVKNTGSAAASYLSLTDTTRTRLKPNTTYMLTLWGAIAVSGSSGGQYVYVTAKRYTDTTGSDAQQTSFTDRQLAPTSSVQQLTYTFTTDSTHIYLSVDIVFPTIPAGRTIVFTGAMLSIGNAVPTEWTPCEDILDDLNEDLLATGIDIARHQIVLTADQLICQNNSGMKTAWLDEVGNFTLAGVLNNLVVTINDDNKSHYGYYDSTNGKFILNPLACGPMLFYNLSYNNLFCKIELPVAFYNGSSTYISYKNSNVEFTLNELRQCVGKKFFFLNYYGAAHSSANLHFVEPNNLLAIRKKRVIYGRQTSKGFNFDDNTAFDFTLDGAIAQSAANNPAVLLDTLYMANDYQCGQGYYFVKIECKLGVYDSHECIYWEIEDVGTALT